MLKRWNFLKTGFYEGIKIGFGFELGEADRYLIRGVSFNMDDTTPAGSGFTNPFDLRSGSRTGAVQFSLTNTRKAPVLRYGRLRKAQPWQEGAPRKWV